MPDRRVMSRRRFLGAGATFAVAGALGIDRRLALAARETRAPAGHELAALRTATAWLNSSPRTAENLRGTVVLVDIGTYTCINWLRTLPYMRAWAAKYAGHGLAVISVHAPEFIFEHDVDNVRQAIEAMRITHPVAIDNSFSIWRAFRNRYWPSRYLMDGRGRIRYRHFGEGEYESTERAIHAALTEAGARGVGRELVSVSGHGVEAAADWDNLHSRETYLGYERAESFGLSDRLMPDEPHFYVTPARLRKDSWALSGLWTVMRQAVRLDRAGGRIEFSFHARDLHLVMGPARRGEKISFRVLVDDMAPGAASGVDVNAHGEGVIAEQRLYQLIRQPKPIRDRHFAIEFLDAGAEAFAFTFG